MRLGEFELIRRYFDVEPPQNAATALGIGDDCALLDIPPGQQLAVTTDAMVETVHFYPHTDPALLGHKLLAVNLSDLAAMGAQPCAVTLSLTLPHADPDWLAAFAGGFLQLARRHQVDLIGGDTTRGPLCLSAQALGLIPAGQALRRGGARPGDMIYLSGDIGDAGLGLKILQGRAFNDPEALERLHRPTPRVELGLQLRGIASSCIDISDGLAADLGHILSMSNVGARLEWDKLPLSAAVSAYILETGDWTLPLTAGDDYELCFTAPPEKQRQIPPGCACIGEIQSQPGLRLRRFGREHPYSGNSGYAHF